MNSRVLICDDEPHIALAVRMKFRSAGIDVVTARDGLQAWEMILHNPPDLLITDCTMPGLDGMQLCRRVRNRPELADLPIFLLTARGLELDSAAVESELRIARLIIKPFSPRELLRDVQETLGTSISSGPIPVT